MATAGARASSRAGAGGHPARAGRPSGALGFALALTACASSGGVPVVPAGELDEASGRPVITAIEDRGGGDIPAVGHVAPVTQDGVAVVGETLWVRGRNFGRQPTVTVAGRPATVVSRTEDGGLLVRVPPGAASGAQAVSVSQEEGRGERIVTIRRIAAARSDDGLTWLALGARGPESLGRAALPGVRAVEFSPEGRAAYALSASGELHVFELAAAGGPAARGKLALTLPVRSLLAAPGAKRLVAIGQDRLVLVDVSSPLVPVRQEIRPVPAWARGTKALRAALSPDGRRLALALPDRNRLVVLALDDLHASAPAPARAELLIAPQVLAPVLADMTFSPDGQTLWLVSGVTFESKAMGPQPTRVHAVRIADGGGALTLAQTRVVEIAGATRPVAIVTGRALPLASGAAIRVPPERTLVHVAGYASADGRPTVFSIGADDSARPALADRRGRLIGRPEVSADDAWLLAPCGDRAGWRVLAVPPTGGREPAAVPLEGRIASADPDVGDWRTGIEIKVQP